MWTIELSTLKVYCPNGIRIGTLKSANLPHGSYTHGLCLDHEKLGHFCIPLIQFGEGVERYFWHDGTTEHQGIVSTESLRREYYLSADHALYVVDDIK